MHANGNFQADWAVTHNCDPHLSSCCPQEEHTKSNTVQQLNIQEDIQFSVWMVQTNT